MERQDWVYTKKFIEDHNAEFKFLEMENDYKIIAKDSWFEVVCFIAKTIPVNPDQEEFELEFKSKGDITLQKPVKTSPFASKVVDGKSLFSRIHGETFSVTIGSTFCDFSIPYPIVKFNGIEIIGCSLGDSVSLKVLDSSQGTYTTLPYYQLNQFGFMVKLPDNEYKRESKYDSDLFQAMIIRIEYVSETEKDIYVNYMLHELK